MKKVKVRYGPSPTGIPHVGNIRTALFNYLIAKNLNGLFYLRIEDTDQNRIVKGAVERIQESLKLLGLNWDGEVIFQSKRLEIYKEHLEILKSKGVVYEDGGAWRFKINTKKDKESWEDVVYGHVEFPTKVLEDFIIIKSDGFPTYHFASVVDDHEMEISHVLRGDEWISSTPKHLQLYQAFGWQPPKFVHLPVILGSDKKKLAKRDGAKTVQEYLAEGYLPEALINFLSLLGWAPKTNQEIFSLSDLTKEFSLDRINKNSPIFNIEKLDWFNGQWIRSISNENLATKIKEQNKSFDKSKIIGVLPIVKDRLNKIDDFKNIAGFFFAKPNLKNHAKDIAISKEVLEKLITEFNKIDAWNNANVSRSTIEMMEKENLTKAQVYRSIGVAISGQLVTPPIFASMEILGKAESIKRLEDAAEKI